mgnify:FL=1
MKVEYTDRIWDILHKHPNHRYNPDNKSKSYILAVWRDFQPQWIEYILTPHYDK